MSGLMGFFDDPMSQLGIGLLGAQGPNLGNNLAQAIQYMQTQRMATDKLNRENRQNELQQLLGMHKLMNEDELPRMLEAAANKQPYTPSPGLAALTQRLYSLSGVGQLPLGPGQSPQPAPQQPASTSPPPEIASQYSMAVKPELRPEGPMPQVSGLMPSAQVSQKPSLPDAGGQPWQVWRAVDPTMKTYMAALAKDNEAKALREGDLVKMDANGNYRSVYQQPKMVPGVVPQRDASGQVTSASAIPGFSDAASQIAGQEAGAREYGKMPYEKPETVQTKGAPTLMTRSQQIEAATGRPPPSPFITPQNLPPISSRETVSPQEQTQRNLKQLQILRSELAGETDPTNRAAIQTEITALSRAVASGQPFTSQKPGLELQDQGAAAAQRELGQKVGGQAAEVFQNGAASVQGKRSLALMSDMAKSYEPGLFQPLKSKFAQYISQLPGVTEDDANKILKTNAGDIQGLTSAAIAMAGKLTRQTDAQPSQLQFLKTLESMPSAERSPQGFQKIMGYLNSMHDYNIDKMVAMQNWLNDPKNQGDPSGFEAAWAQQAKSGPYIWNQQPTATAGSRRYNPATGKIE